MKRFFRSFSPSAIMNPSAPRIRIPIAETLEMVLNSVACEAGVTLLLYAPPIRLVHEGTVAFGFAIAGKNGQQVVRADTIVDTTEEGLLWRYNDALPTGSAVPARFSVFFNPLSCK